MRVRSLTFSVVGTGLIGGSLLRRLVETGTDVIGWDADPATARLAADRDLPFADDLSTAVGGRDVVILAAPVSALLATVDRIAPHVAADAIVTDVGSTKSDIAAAAKAGPLAGRFIPGHPMAGTEKAGLAAADAHLFDGAAWVLCPDSDVPLQRIRSLISIVTTIFNAHVTIMSPSQHDEVVALSSHIPHLLAGALAGAVGLSELEDAVLGLAAGSFRDGTRVAGTNPQRTVDMLVHNTDAVTRRLTGVQQMLTEMTAAVTARDTDRLVGLFTSAQRVRDRLTDRGQTPMTRRFSDAHDEREFLSTTGRHGSYVTSCFTDGEQVTYSTLE